MRLREPEITVARVGPSITVVTVQGELDLHCAEEFRTALDDDGQRSARRVVVDLVGTTFIDSTALGIIAGAAKTAARGGGTLTVVASDPRIVRIFKLTGLDRAITVEGSLAEAIAHRLPATSA